jgi:hypothetical protein
LFLSGHNVRINVDPFFEPAVKKAGLRFFPLDGFDPIELMKKQHGHQPWYSYLVENTDMYLEQFAACFASNWRAAQEPWPGSDEPFKADAFIISQHMMAIWPIAAKFNAPVYVFNTYPIIKTSEFRAPNSILMQSREGGNPLVNNSLINNFSFNLYDGLHEIFLAEKFKIHCENIGVDPKFPVVTPGFMNKMRIPNLGIWSPSIVPRPSDWNSNCVIVGDVTRAGGLATVPEDLEKWCKSVKDGGPVFFGFGSVREKFQKSFN